MNTEIMQKQMKLVKANNPFDCRDREEAVIYIKDGYTVQDAIDKYYPNEEDIIVTLNGKEVTNFDTLLRPGDFLLLVPAVEGSEGGRIAAMIGIAIVAWWAGPAAAGAMNLAGNAATFAAGVVSSAVMIGGGLLVNHLMPYPSQRSAASGNSQAYGWNPKTTQQAGIKWPVYYGENKVYGNVISSMTEPVTDSRKQVYNLIIGLAEGPIESISDLKINNQDIDEFEDVKYETRKGYTRQPILKNFMREGVQEVASELIESDSPYTFTHVYNETYDSFEVDCGHPNGLYKIDDLGDIGPYFAVVKFEYKKEDESEWTIAEPENRKYSVYAMRRDKYGLLELLVDTYPDGFYGSNITELIANRLFLPNDDWNYYRPNELKVANFPDDVLSVIDYSADSMFKINNVSLPSSTDITIEEEEGDSAYDENEVSKSYWFNDKRYRWMRTSISVTGFIPDIYALTEDQGASLATIRDMNHIFSDNITSNHRFSFGPFDYDKTAESGTNYNIRISKINATRKDANGNKLTNYGQDLRYLGIRDFVEYNQSHPRLACVGIKSIATDDLSGSLDFECVIKGKKVRVYDSYSETWNVQYSNNPAWVLYDIMTQPVYSNAEGDPFIVARYDGLQPEYVNLDSIVDFAEYCGEILEDGYPRHTFNGGFVDEKSVHDQILEICQQCRAIYVWNGAKAYIVIDKPDQYRQVFSMSNIENYSFGEQFIQEDQRATAIEVQFLDKDLDYKRTSYIVSSNTADRNSNKVSMFYSGINNSREAWRAGKFRLNRNRDLRRTISFKTSVNAINFMVGDVFLFQHDVPDWGKSCRVFEATENTVTLAQDLDIDPDKNWSIIIRPTNQAEGSGNECYDKIISKPVASVDGRVITVTEGFTSAIEKGDLVVLVENVPKLFRVTYLRASQNQKVEVHGIEYKESVYDVDSEDPGTPVEVIQPKPVGLQPVNNLTVVETYVLGESYVTLNISWENPDIAYIQKGVDLYAQVDGSSSWTYLGFSTDNRFVWDKALPNTTYRIKAVTIGLNGETYPFNKSITVSLTTTDQNTTVPNYDGISVTGLRLTNFPNSDIFATKNAQFSWNVPATSVSENGSSSIAGFANYSIIIENPDGTTRRKESTTDNNYTYTYENNYEDGNGTPARSFVFTVAAVDVNGYKTNYTRLPVSNPVPGAITGLNAVGSVKRIDVKWDTSLESDIAGYKVWGATVDGFTPSDDNLLYKGPNNALTLATTDTMYFKVAAYDNFGDTNLNISGQAMAIPSSSTSEITDYNLDYITTKDFAITIEDGNVLTVPADKSISFRNKAYITTGKTFTLSDVSKTYYVYYDFTNYLTESSDLVLRFTTVQPGLSYWKFLFAIAQHNGSSWVVSQPATPQRIISGAAIMQVGSITADLIGANSIKATHIDTNSVNLTAIDSTAASQLSSNTGNISSLGTTVYSHTTTISAYGTTISSHTSSIANLQTQINNVGSPSWADVTGKPAPLGDVDATGLFLTSTYLGFAVVSGSDVTWTNYLDSSGNAVFKKSLTVGSYGADVAGYTVIVDSSGNTKARQRSAVGSSGKMSVVSDTNGISIYYGTSGTYDTIEATTKKGFIGGVNDSISSPICAFETCAFGENFATPFSNYNTVFRVNAQQAHLGKRFSTSQYTTGGDTPKAWIDYCSNEGGTGSEFGFFCTASSLVFGKGDNSATAYRDRKFNRNGIFFDSGWLNSVSSGVAVYSSSGVGIAANQVVQVAHLLGKRPNYYKLQIRRNSDKRYCPEYYFLYGSGYHHGTFISNIDSTNIYITLCGTSCFLDGGDSTPTWTTDPIEIRIFAWL